MECPICRAQMDFLGECPRCNEAQKAREALENISRNLEQERYELEQQRYEAENLRSLIEKERFEAQERAEEMLERSKKNAEYLHRNKNKLQAEGILENVKTLCNCGLQEQAFQQALLAIQIYPSAHAFNWAAVTDKSIEDSLHYYEKAWLLDKQDDFIRMNYAQTCLLVANKLVPETKQDTYLAKAEELLLVYSKDTRTPHLRKELLETYIKKAQTTGKDAGNYFLKAEKVFLCGIYENIGNIDYALGELKKIPKCIAGIATMKAIKALQQKMLDSMPQMDNSYWLDVQNLKKTIDDYILEEITETKDSIGVINNVLEYKYKNLKEISKIIEKGNQSKKASSNEIENKKQEPAQSLALFLIELVIIFFLMWMIPGFKEAVVPVKDDFINCMRLFFCVFVFVYIICAVIYGFSLFESIKNIEENKEHLRLICTQGGIIFLILCSQGFVLAIVAILVPVILPALISRIAYGISTNRIAAFERQQREKIEKESKSLAEEIIFLTQS